MTTAHTTPQHKIISSALILPEENIDTDQIIPARFLTTTESAGLGKYAFIDWRNEENGQPRTNCALHDERASSCSILIAGNNFGCGSSREHAPWALHDMGIRAVVSTQIADIFRANAAKNGIVAVVIPESAYRQLQQHPWCQVQIDIEARQISFLDQAPIDFPLDSFTRRCLMDGVDELGFLLSQDSAICSFEAAHKS